MLPSKAFSKSLAQCQRHKGLPRTVAVATTMGREQEFTPNPPQLNENLSLHIWERTPTLGAVLPILLRLLPQSRFLVAAPDEVERIL